MEEFIARENIKRFRAKLRSSCDAQQRTIIRELLEAEEMKLEQARAAKRAPTNS